MGPLVTIFNNCLTEGIFPRTLKVSRVVPIYKKGDADHANSYRPVAITPVLGKALEVILKSRLLGFIEGSGILVPNQFGFREGRSTTDAVMSIIQDAVAGFDSGQRTLLTLCDLTKAFDCLLPDLLFAKLEACGVRGVPLQFIQSYFNDRKQYVSFRNGRSGLLQQSYGVPQGSVIGPLFFIIYINDLSSFVTRASTTLFADDTTLCVRGRDLAVTEGAMTEALTQASDWFLANGLSLNDSKTQKILLTTDKTTSLFPPVTLLGMKIDQHLTWSSHINFICAKISRGLYALRRISGLLSMEVRLTAFYALIQCHLSYGVILWGQSADLGDAFILQKRAIRVIVRGGSPGALPSVVQVSRDSYSAVSVYLCHLPLCSR